MKKLISLWLALAMVFSLAACSSQYSEDDDEDDGIRRPSRYPSEPTESKDLNWPWNPTQPTETTQPTAPAPTEPTQPEKQIYSITMWVPDESLMGAVRQLVEQYNQSVDTAYRFELDIAVVSTYDVANLACSFSSDVADLYVYGQESLQSLVQAGALSSLNDKYLVETKANHDAGSITAATYENELYGFPLEHANGYFMYYDRSLISPDDATSLEKLITICEANNRTFCIDLENGWYLSSFFFATGCVSQWQMENGEFVGVEDSFYSQEGIVAVEAVKKLLQSRCYRADYYPGGSSNPPAVYISGNWDYDAMKQVLPGRLGVAELPSFTVDGQRYHLSSFSGTRLLGVSPQEDAQRQQALMELAQFLTDTECQIEYCYTVGQIPTNIVAQNETAENLQPWMAALIQQNQYAVPQRLIHEQWWDMIQAIIPSLMAGHDAKTVLAVYDAEVRGVLEEEAVWSVIGTVDGTYWDVDFVMEKRADGTYRTQKALFLYVSSEFKIRLNRAWDVNYGANGELNGPNCRPQTAGYFYVVFNPQTGEYWLEV